MKQWEGQEEMWLDDLMGKGHFGESALNMEQY
jgi:hypothetical protein